MLITYTLAEMCFIFNNEKDLVYQNHNDPSLVNWLGANDFQIKAISFLHKEFRRFYLHLFTACFMKIARQSSEQI